MSVPRLSVRLDCMLYRRKMDLEMEELKPELLILRSAAREMRDSRRLKALLGVSPPCEFTLSPIMLTTAGTDRSRARQRIER